MLSQEDISRLTVHAEHAAKNESQSAARLGLAKFTAETFTAVGTELHAVGHVIGTDRMNGLSPGGHGSDEMVAVSLLFRVAGQLTSASADLFADGRDYAASALVRQMVEVEYLAGRSKLATTMRSVGCGAQMMNGANSSSRPSSAPLLTGVSAGVTTATTVSWAVTPCRSRSSSSKTTWQYVN
jgi:hypothetical protein